MPSVSEAELFDLECHFAWIPEDLFSQDPLKTLQYLEDDLIENEDVVLLGGSFLAFLRAQLGTKTDMRRALEEAEKAVKVTQDPSKEKDPQRRIGFQLVALGNLAHIQYALRDDSGLQETMKSIQDLKVQAEARDTGDFTKVNGKPRSKRNWKQKKGEHGGGDDQRNTEEGTSKCKKLVSACIVGSHAYSLNQLGLFKEGLVLFREAEELDPENYMWPLGRGVTAGRLQRHYIRGLSESDSVLNQLDKEQEESLERSADLTNHGHYLILTRLADVYFWRGRGIPSKPHTQNLNLMKKTEQLLLEAYELNPESATLLKRIGKALPEVDRSHEPFAEQCLLRAKDLEPTNSMGLHRLGQFYEHASYKFKDLAKAEACYMEAVESGPSRNLCADMDLGRVRKKKDSSYDMYEHIIRLKALYLNDGDQEVIRNRLRILEAAAARRSRMTRKTQV